MPQISEPDLKENHIIETLEKRNAPFPHRIPLLGNNGELETFDICTATLD
jgi:hypothetical protein